MERPELQMLLDLHLHETVAPLVELDELLEIVDVRDEIGDVKRELLLGPLAAGEPGEERHSDLRAETEFPQQLEGHRLLASELVEGARMGPSTDT